MIDPFTIKPLDASTILASARATGGRIITVEDHYKEGELYLSGSLKLSGSTEGVKKTGGLYFQADLVRLSCQLSARSLALL